MSEQRGRDDANNCFACGPDNSIGLHIKFRLDDGICHGEFTPGDNHEGFHGVTHGGILFAALDDVMANWLFLQGIRGYTARCEIRYREPTPTHTRILLEGSCEKQRSRMVQLQGVAKRADNQAVVAETSAVFMIEPGGNALTS
jgi:acyl-coenzyme A thioesterase PaaI-like protein